MRQLHQLDYKTALSGDYFAAPDERKETHADRLLLRTLSPYSAARMIAKLTACSFAQLTWCTSKLILQTDTMFYEVFIGVCRNPCFSVLEDNNNMARGHKAGGLAAFVT